VPSDKAAFGRHAASFWVGVTLTTIGVAMHLPMYIEARTLGYRLAGMRPDAPMVSGMILVVGGLTATAFGLLPRQGRHATARLRVRAIDDAPMGMVHVRLLLIMAVAVTIDVMKPTTLAFVVPGMTEEYGLRSPLNPTGPSAALLPLFGIAGTTLGALAWGWLGDRIGRRGAMLLAGVIFMATAVCGAMPSYGLNLVMCFVMGLGAGGMLPVAFTLLSETIPARHRGWLLVLIGGDIAGAYVITSWLSSSLTPSYSWRILWLIGMPTGLLLVLLTRWIPESPRYLLAVGRETEAQAVLREYRAEIVPIEQPELDVEAGVASQFRQLLRPPFRGLTVVIAVIAIGTGLVIYGFQLWLPTNLRRLGYSGVTADRILRDAALLGFPLNFLVAYLYHRSARRVLIGLTGAIAVVLAIFVVLGDRVVDNRMLLDVLLVVPVWGASSVVAVLSAYSAEVYPTRIRSRGSGFAAAMAKTGGVVLIAAVATAVTVPSLRVTAALGAIPMAAAAVMSVVLLIETRQRRLEEITATQLSRGVLRGAAGSAAFLSRRR
jgi:putative MFS transporter